MPEVLSFAHFIQYTILKTREHSSEMEMKGGGGLNQPPRKGKYLDTLGNSSAEELVCLSLYAHQG